MASTADAAFASADVEMQDASTGIRNSNQSNGYSNYYLRNGRHGNGSSANGSAAPYRGINRYLQDLLQTAVGNLPELVFNISRERGISNEEAMRFLQDEITRLVTRVSTEVGVQPPGPVSDSEVAKLRATIERDRETIEALEAEVNVVKRIFSKNKDVGRQERRKVSDLQAKVCRLQQELKKERERVARQAEEAIEAAASSSANVVAAAVNEARSNAASLSESRARQLEADLLDSRAQLERARADWQHEYENLRTNCERERQEMNALRVLLAEQRRKNSAEHRRLREIVVAVYPDVAANRDDSAEHFDLIVSRLSAMLNDYQTSADAYAELENVRDALEQRVRTLTSDLERVTQNDTRFEQIVSLVRNSENELAAAIRRREEVTNERMYRLSHVRQRLVETEMLMRRLGLQEYEDPTDPRLTPSQANIVIARNNLRQECVQLLQALGVRDIGQISGEAVVEQANVVLRSPSRAASRAGTPLPSRLGEQSPGSLAVVPANLAVEARAPVDQDSQREVEMYSRNVHDARLRMSRMRSEDAVVQQMLGELSVYLAEQQQLDRALQRVAHVRSLATYDPALISSTSRVPIVTGPTVPSNSVNASPQYDSGSSSAESDTATAMDAMSEQQQPLNNDSRPRPSPSPFVPIAAEEPSPLERPPDFRVVQLLSSVRRGGTSTGVSVQPNLSTIEENETRPATELTFDDIVAEATNGANLANVVTDTSLPQQNNRDLETPSFINALAPSSTSNGSPIATHELLQGSPALAVADAMRRAALGGGSSTAGTPAPRNNGTPAPETDVTPALGSDVTSVPVSGVTSTPVNIGGASNAAETLSASPNLEANTQYNVTSDADALAALEESIRRSAYDFEAYVPSTVASAAETRDSPLVVRLRSHRGRETTASAATVRRGAVAENEETVDSEDAEVARVNTVASSPTQATVARPASRAARRPGSRLSQRVLSRASSVRSVARAPSRSSQRLASRARAASNVSSNSETTNVADNGSSELPNVTEPIAQQSNTERVTRSRSRQRQVSESDTNEPPRRRERSRSPLAAAVFVDEQEIGNVPTPQSVTATETYEFAVEEDEYDDNYSDNDEAVNVPAIRFD